MDEDAADPEGRCVGAEDVVDEDEPVRWCGGGCAGGDREELGVFALALEDPLPVRALAGSGADVAGGGAAWGEEPLRPREAEPLRGACEDD